MKRCGLVLMFVVSTLTTSFFSPANAATKNTTNSIRVGTVSNDVAEGCGTYAEIGQRTVMFSGYGEKKSLMVLDGKPVSLSEVKEFHGRLPKFTITGGGYTVTVKASKDVTPPAAEEAVDYLATLVIKKGSRQTKLAVTLGQGC
jgi:hypothetical protein